MWKQRTDPDITRDVHSVLSKEIRRPGGSRSGQPALKMVGLQHKTQTLNRHRIETARRGSRKVFRKSGRQCDRGFNKPEKGHRDRPTAGSSQPH